MKKVLLTLFVLMLAVSLVGCGSTYGKIKSAFEEKGYTEVEYVESDEEKAMKEELKEEGIEYTVHELEEDGLLGKKTVYVFEFTNVDGLKKALTQEGDFADMMKAFLEEADTSYEEIYNELEEMGFVNGNCMFSAFGFEYLEALNIFKSAK